MEEQRKHFAVDKLSENARRIVETGLCAGDTYTAIIAAVKVATGEKLAHSSLQRYYSRKWLPEKRRIEELRAAATAKAELDRDMKE
jgi:hypothetical protein